MRRRTFLQTTAAATLLAGVTKPTFGLPSTHPYLKTIGLQLWTVRNQLAEDVPTTIAAVADAGYYQVELMRVLDADTVLPAIHDNGLTVTSAFIDWQAIGVPGEGPSFAAIVEKAHEIGLKHLVFGYIGKGHRETVEHFQRHAERANRAGEKCRQAGIQLCYHNHSFEFAELDGDRAGWDVLVDEFDKELVKFEVDVFWVAIGGRDPIAAMRPLKGRISQVHLKDLKQGTAVEHDEGKIPPEAFQELGDGVIEMRRVIDVALECGAEQCHVEQDQSPDPIASIKQSMGYLRRVS